MEDKTFLRRELSCSDCVAIIVGIIIGTGIFSVFPSLIAQHNISTTIILLSWLIGGLFAWFGAMCYAELSSLLPWAGGDYVFLRKAYSIKGESLVSFLFAWSQVLIIRPASIAVLALIFGSELQNVLAYFNISVWQSALMTAIILTSIFTLINMLGIRTGRGFQNITTVLKIGILIFIIGWGFIKLPAQETSLAPLLLPTGKSFFGISSGFWSAMVLTMWVYGGWNEAVYVAEETKNPYGSIPKALFLGIFSSIILYLAINFIYLRHLSPSGLANNWNPASSLMSAWFGAKGGIIMAIIVMISAASAINGLILTGGRVTYAVTKDFPRLNSLSLISANHQVPEVALFVNCVITTILLLISNGKLTFVENLTFYTAGVYWYFFALVIIALLILRAQVPKEEIPYKVPLYPILPILFLLIIVGIIWGAIKFKPLETLTGISILTLGIPLYYALYIGILKKNLFLEDKE